MNIAFRDVDSVWVTIYNSYIGPARLYTIFVNGYHHRIIQLGNIILC